MVISSIELTRHGVTFNEVSRQNDIYFFCVYDNMSIINKSAEDMPVTGRTAHLKSIFGADTYDNLEAEITRLGLS